MVYVHFLKNVLKKANYDASITHLPMKTERITLLKSPHVNKKAKEQFETRTHKVVATFKEITVSSTFLKFIILNKPKQIFAKLKT